MNFDDSYNKQFAVESNKVWIVKENLLGPGGVGTHAYP